MLQQTQVATVLDYYQRFINRFPNVFALAAAEQQDVLELWAGLGYYRRARNLHLAAQQVVHQHAGVFPHQVSELMKLSGIGRYTAGAIASIAFDAPAPILETNTIRLFSRLMAMKAPVSLTSSQQELWRLAESLLPKSKGSGKVNQAFMELGSLICTPTNPKCSDCPLRTGCRAHQLGLEHTIPLLKLRPPSQNRTHIGLLIRNAQDRILMRCNPHGQWWAGLWDLPWIELSSFHHIDQDCVTTAEVERMVVEKFDLLCKVSKPIQSIRHSVTRFRIEYHCVSATLLRPSVLRRKGWAWARAGELPPVVARFRRLRLPKRH